MRPESDFLSSESVFLTSSFNICHIAKPLDSHELPTHPTSLPWFGKLSHSCYSATSPPAPAFEKVRREDYHAHIDELCEPNSMRGGAVVRQCLCPPYISSVIVEPILLSFENTSWQNMSILQELERVPKYSQSILMRSVYLCV